MGPYHHGMACPQVADGGDGLQMRKAVANILNDQPRTSDKGCSSILGVGRGLTSLRFNEPAYWELLHNGGLL